MRKRNLIKELIDMEIKEVRCPDCHKVLCDIRDREDRIDFWCFRCKKKFQYKDLVKDDQ